MKHIERSNTETTRIVVVSKGWGKRKWKVGFERAKFQFCKVKKFWRCALVTVTQKNDYT
jgi:hypothetical protein